MAAKGATRATQDAAGGVILGGSTKVFVEGKPVALLGSPVTPHDEDEHENATMTATTTKVRCGGIAPVRVGDPATCGHLATGSTKVFFG